MAKTTKKLTPHQYNKRELDQVIFSINYARSEYERIKKSYEPVIKLIRERVSMERRGEFFIFSTYDDDGCERVIFARKDKKTKRWVLRENRKQIMNKCPYNLNEIRLKIATGEI